MKELYCRRINDTVRGFVVKDDEPFASFTYSADSLNKYDIVSVSASSPAPETGGFFADIGKGKTAFCDDNMPGRGRVFPAGILSLPEGTKSYRISPVITFTGLFVHAQFVPSFSRQRPGKTLSVSRRISEKRRAYLESVFGEICKEFSFEGYASCFTLRTLCEEDVKNDIILSEIRGFANEFRRIIETSEGSVTVRKAPAGTLLYKRSLPEYVLSALKTTDYEKIISDEAGMTLAFQKVFGNLPHEPEIGTYGDMERLFIIKDSLAEFSVYSGKTFYTKSGARVVYDKTEAMHVFDINSGGSWKSPLEINLECCDIISRVCSVKNLTGIIMIDFINMRSHEDEKAVADKMTALAGEDYRPFKIYGFTALKVLECARYK